MCGNFGDFSFSEANRQLGAWPPDDRQGETNFATCDLKQLGPEHGHSMREA